jgi:hypothetical protein
MTRYGLVPQHDLERQTSGPCIESIRVSRKEKADGTVVRIKETFFSDGTSSAEEKIISRPSKSLLNPSSREQKSRHRSREKRTIPSSTQHQPTNDHSMEFLPISIDKPAPIMILPHYRLPQSKSSRIYVIMCRFCLLLFLFMLCLAIWWFQGQNHPTQYIQNLFNL